jgi:hypothetical protein
MGSIPNGSAPLQACARQIFKLRYRAAPEGASSYCPLRVTFTLVRALSMEFWALRVDLVPKSIV